MNKLAVILLLLAVLALSGGCGQKGDLYLPDKQTDDEQTEREKSEPKENG